jgi:hypothetical protein
MCHHIFMCGDTMGNMTLSIPDEIQKQMRQFNEIKWSEVARKAIIERLETLKLAEELAKKSKLTPKDASLLSKKINAAASKRFMDEHST